MALLGSAPPLAAQIASIPSSSALVSRGVTCPPVAAPPAGAGVIYTCTGTGAAYVWNGSAWIAAGGSAGAGTRLTAPAIPIGTDGTTGLLWLDGADDLASVFGISNATAQGNGKQGMTQLYVGNDGNFNIYVYNTLNDTSDSVTVTLYLGAQGPSSGAFWEWKGADQWFQTDVYLLNGTHTPTISLEKEGDGIFVGSVTAADFIGSEISPPAAPAANSGVIFFQDSGGGKTQACARFNTGAVQCFATEP